MYIKLLKRMLMVCIIIAAFSGYDLIKIATGENSGVRVSKIKKDVKIKRQDSQAWQDAQLHMTLLSGDSIKTGKDSAAVLKFAYPANNSFHLYENTEITVAKLIKGKDVPVKQIDIKMLKGGTWAKLKGVESKKFKFNLTTPNTVAAISGTSLATIVFENGDTYFCSCDGIIDVGAPGQAVTITRAQGTTVTGNQPPTKPINDLNIITEKKYEKDPRYGWCIDCHQRIKASQTTFDRFCVWGVRVGVFPGCCAKNCIPKDF